MKYRFFPLILLTAIIAAASFGQGPDPSRLSLRVGAGYGSVAATTDTAITPAAVRALEKDAFQLINTERSLAGLSTLKWSDKIAAVARFHSDNMAGKNFFSHKGLDGLMVDDRAAQLKMGPWSAIGENIAYMKGYENPVEMAVQKWLDSPGHKKNLLDPYWTETAIGMAVTEDGKYYFTQVFIR